LLILAECVNAQQSAVPGNVGPGNVSNSADVQLLALQKNAQDLQQQMALAQAPATATRDDTLQKRVELLQKQIDTQRKMIELLVEQVKKQPAPAAPSEKVQTDLALLQSRSTQAAQRDQDLANAVDNLVEHVDAEERNGPRLPAQ